VAIRSLKLIALSQLLYMGGSEPYRFQIINVLCQIALTYFLVMYYMNDWLYRRKIFIKV
jgi:hypothetical protein